MAITGLSDPVMAETDQKLICTIIRIKPKAGGLFGIKFITASQVSCGKVMFLVICVGHLVHVTISHDVIGQSQITWGPISTIPCVPANRDPPYGNQH